MASIFGMRVARDGAGKSAETEPPEGTFSDGWLILQRLMCVFRPDPPRQGNPSERDGGRAPSASPERRSEPGI
jgi:hypothetical protein